MKWMDVIKNQQRPVRFLFSRLLRNTGLWRLVKIHEEDYFLRLHPASLALSLWVNHGDRDYDCKVVKRLLKPGDTYVDIGANIGQLVVVAALAVTSRGTVLAFEAHPRTAGYLRENIKLNGLKNVKVAQFAVGDKEGWVSFSDERADDQNKVAEKGLTVPIVRLQPFLDDVRYINLLKIDVEGYEKFVLLGAGDALRKVQIVYFEAMDAHYQACGYKFSEVYDILVTHGFVIGRVEGAQFKSVERDSLFGACCNLFAVRDIESFLLRFRNM